MSKLEVWITGISKKKTDLNKDIRNIENVQIYFDLFLEQLCNTGKSQTPCDINTYNSGGHYV